LILKVCFFELFFTSIFCCFLTKSGNSISLLFISYDAKENFFRTLQFILENKFGCFLSSREDLFCGSLRDNSIRLEIPTEFSVLRTLDNVQCLPITIFGISEMALILFLGIYFFENCIYSLLGQLSQFIPTHVFLIKNTTDKVWQLIKFLKLLETKNRKTLENLEDNDHERQTEQDEECGWEMNRILGFV
jgi:hypothetical protein